MVESRFGKAREIYRRLVDLRSENVKGLLAEGVVEKLVREGRSPLNLGRVGHIVDGQVIFNQYYQIPPRGFNPKKTEIFMSAGGCYAFKKRGRRPQIGSTFTLAETQAGEVEKRIEAEKERLGLGENL